MTESAPSVLVPWANFYILTGSAAGALTGLVFVVITLVSDEERASKHQDGVATFSTPTVVHFGTVLLVSAILSAPWHQLAYPAALLGFAGLCGVIYQGRVVYRTRRLTVYRPDLEDWTWYTVLPIVAYGALLAGAIVLPKSAESALFAIACGVLGLTFIGIRNAWDVVTFLAIGPSDPPSSTG